MRSRLVLVVAALAGCGGHGGNQPDGGFATPDVPMLPPAKCVAPVDLVDVSSPSTVVGTGTSASCTEASLAAAVAQGGIITFDCGAAETTITLTAPLAAPTDNDTTIRR